MIYINSNSLMAHQFLMDINANNIVNTKNTRNEAHIENNLEVKSNQINESNLIKDLTEQIIIENGFKVQVPAIKTQDEIIKTILDIKI